MKHFQFPARAWIGPDTWGISLDGNGRQQLSVFLCYLAWVDFDGFGGICWNVENVEIGGLPSHLCRLSLVSAVVLTFGRQVEQNMPSRQSAWVRPTIFLWVIVERFLCTSIACLWESDLHCLRQLILELESRQHPGPSATIPLRHAARHVAGRTGQSESIQRNLNIDTRDSESHSRYTIFVFDNVSNIQTISHNFKHIPSVFCGLKPMDTKRWISSTSCPFKTQVPRHLHRETMDLEAGEARRGPSVCLACWLQPVAYRFWHVLKLLMKKLGIPVSCAHRPEIRPKGVLWHYFQAGDCTTT